MAKVLISDKISKSAVQIFKNNKIEVDYKPGISEDELNNIIYDYDALAIRSATKVTEKIIEKAQKLKNLKSLEEQELERTILIKKLQQKKVLL